MRWRVNTRVVLSQLTALALCLVMLFVCGKPVLARGYEDAPEATLRRMGIYFTSLDDPCTGSISDVANGNTPENLKEAQEANAKTIIGIAKSLNLDRQAALIGLMVALTESHLKMYASRVVPVSQKNPAWLALPTPRPIGEDYDSVGVFQQRVSMGWSTFGNGESQDIVWQLMDPAYSAQAFFGTPKGASLPDGLKQPSALKKGLVNKVPNYNSLDPWIAAQKVQISAFEDGSNYKKNLETAQALLRKYASNWDAVEAVPLPIALNAPGSTGPKSIASPEDCTTDFGAGDDSALQKKIYDYAWHEYHKAPYKVMTKAYAAAVKAAQSRPDDYVGGGMYPGIDCNGFVTRVMRDSGFDPEYNKVRGTVRENRAYMEAHPEKYERMPHITSTSQLRPGDVWVNQFGTHTYIFAGEGDQAMPADFKGNAASASFGGDSPNGSWRTPMATVAYDLNETWYRVKK